MKTSRIVARVSTLAVFVALLCLPALLLPLAASAAPGTLAAPAQDSRTADLQMAPLNPQFVLWQARRDFNTVLGSIDGHGLGLRPALKAATSTAPSSRLPRLSYAPSFDLRTTGKLTSVKDQGSWGTCWAFAANGSMESWLLPGDARDFSEDHMVLTAGFDTGSTPEQRYAYGGSVVMAMAYLVRWGGPVWESDDAYGDSHTPTGLTARSHVQDVTLYERRASATDNDRIKYALTTHGATYVAVSMQGSAYGSSYYNPTTSAYYYDGSLATNHAVLAVGWDDAYPASNFATTPPGDGAFIVRNSWGTGWGDAGYFYVSYYDSQFGRDDFAATVENVQPVDNYDSIYQYDPLGSVTDLGYGAGLAAWGANRFTAAVDSTLDAVGFYAVAPDTAYEVWQGPSLADLTKVTQGTLPRMGFHTVTLPAGRALAGGDSFVVAVKLITPSYNWPLAVEYPFPGYSTAATAGPGESYVSPDGTSWSDLTTLYPGTNACIKAYVSTGSPPPPTDTTPPVTTVYGWDDLWHNRDVQLTLTAVDEPGGSGVATVSGQFNDGTVYPIPGDSAVATFLAPSDHANDGVTKLTYWATDVAGNEETPRSLFVKIDTRGPVTAAKAASGRKGRAIVLRYKITDALSPKATAIRIVVKNSRGTTVKTFKPATRNTGTWYSVKWTPKARGTFRYSVYAKDLAGNAQGTRGSAKVVVK
jgi:C1A family cysteine protease